MIDSLYINVEQFFPLSVSFSSSQFHKPAPRYLVGFHRILKCTPGFFFPWASPKFCGHLFVVNSATVGQQIQ
jgi:hypothetical protein